MKKDIVTLWDLTKEDFDSLFRRSLELKIRLKQGTRDTPLTGKSLGLIFEKASTRTRISFETAMIQLGGHPIFISVKDTQLARDEPVRDTARVLSRYLDGLVMRTYSQGFIEEMAKAASIPVINGLSDLYHPCQILSDILTVMEKKGTYGGLKIAWVGDGNNMAHSWIEAAAILGLQLVLACPDGYHPDPSVLNRALKESCGEITVTADPEEAVSDADVINTDVWASMGQEGEAEERFKAFEKYQINSDLVAKAKKDAIVMHCLPAHRGEEITDEVLEGEHSVVWDQAENKMHIHKAILESLLKE
ncbi:ornithine carbamoyltransferase [Desulfobacterales bacterium HSG2]|nr:ornithine carbamoyltransferase [Desulfobacterales bacterium HSG2]